MSLTGPYDDGNVFARILRGELPCHKLYEDADTLAFLDLFPQAEGHALVIPRHATARTLLDADDATLAALVRTARTVAQALVDELAPDGVQLMQFSGAAAGQTVFHLHLHLIPRRSGSDPLAAHAQRPGDPAELAALAARLSARLGGAAAGEGA